MRLVPEYGALTNGRAKAMFRYLQDTQQRFLHCSMTCVTQDIRTLNLDSNESQVDLRAILMSIPDPSKPGKKLFHAVNNRGLDDGIIFHFHPRKSNDTYAMVAQISKIAKAMQMCNAIPTTSYKFPRRLQVHLLPINSTLLWITW